MNVGWLDSSLSIMEQGVREFDVLLLRFKYYSFYDLNFKHDAVRINLIYEQAKWQLLNEGIDCTEEEMMLFAALQLQVGLQNNVPQPHELYDEDDDVDAALTDLQVSLEGTAINGQNRTQVPHLADSLRYFRPRRFTLKSFKRLYFVIRDLQLTGYKSSDMARSGRGEAAVNVNLKGCEVTPEINLTQRKYQIKLEMPSAEGMSEMWLRCDTVRFNLSPIYGLAQLTFPTCSRRVSTRVGWPPCAWPPRARRWPTAATTWRSSRSRPSWQCSTRPASQSSTPTRWTSTWRTTSRQGSSGR